MKAKLYVLVLMTLVSGHVMSQDLFEEVTFGEGTFAIPAARGIAVSDYDNDGDQDIFVSGEVSELYRNDGNFVFTNVTEEARVTGTRAITATWADIDNDGWLDLIATSWFDARIYMNNGDGTFRAGSDLPLKKRNLVMAGDLNGDGWIDLFSSNFRNPSELLLNDGFGGFVDFGAAAGVNVNENGMGGLLIDIDEDGDLDIFVTYDGDQPGRLFMNNGSGEFTDEADAYGLNLEAQAMGVDMGDVNNDGRPDFYVTNLEDNFLYIAQADGSYDEVAVATQVNDKGMGWGVRIADYDNDGLPDIYINNEYDYSPFENRLYRNEGGLSFTDIAAGTGLDNFESGYGTASADLNNDGALEIIVVNDNPDNALRIFRNTGGTSNHWLQIEVVGVTTNKFAIGTRAQAYRNGQVKIDQVTAGSGWASQNGFRLHFGLGNWDELDSVVLYWPDGQKERVENVAADQRVLWVQGQGIGSADQKAQQLAIPRDLQYPFLNLDFLPEENLSVARQWNEILLTAIRFDFARPTVHARNLFHLSAVMYDAWAAYEGNTFLLGKRFGNFEFPFVGVPAPSDIEAAREEAISFAAYRLIRHRFANSPGAGFVNFLCDELMERMGYDVTYSGVLYDVAPNRPAALGNYLAQRMIEFGQQDGSNEQNDYINTYYESINEPLRPLDAGTPGMNDPNRWQPLEFDVFIDQSGNQSSATPDFLSAEWGNVTPFSLPGIERVVKNRDGNPWSIYLDPGSPPMISDTEGLEDDFKWHHAMVSVWASHLDYTDGEMIDISPRSMGNSGEIDASQAGMEAFYDYFNGTDASQGYEINPTTGNPYTEQMVPRGDFARVLAEFWADGPDSETPPGHWFTIMNYVHDHPAFDRRMQGEGAPLPQLEWHVKAYLTMGGAMHDAAVAAWSVKGYYDYVRPISAIRYMAERGQSSDLTQPRYDPHGLPLIPGYIEVIKAGDPLAGPENQNLNKIKLFTWRGHDNYNEDFVAGVGWILGTEWISYQRATFVTPPFAGYVSGHSTFSRAAAEVLSKLTGSEYFPGGMGEFVARQDNFLVFERGPSVDVRLQWARYQDAADQSALSRIWGGIHPPADDLPGRLIGLQVGEYAFDKAMRIFSGETVTSSDLMIEEEKMVYPNPVMAGGRLNFQIPAGTGTVSFRDVSGKLIHTQKIDGSGKSYIDLPVLNPGLYLVEILGSGERSVHKVIVRP